MSIASKVAYVKAQGQTRNHHCHWPGCDKQVPPSKWGCTPHWYALPPELRQRIWATFRPGQEVNGTPSRAYLEAARAVQAWIEHQRTPARLAHEWDEDACCIHCGHDGAESRHLVTVAGYELTEDDRWCEARERLAAAPTPKQEGLF